MGFLGGSERISTKLRNGSENLQAFIVKERWDNALTQALEIIDLLDEILQAKPLAVKGEGKVTDSQAQAISDIGREKLKKLQKRSR